MLFGEVRPAPAVGPYTGRETCPTCLRPSSRRRLTNGSVATKYDASSAYGKQPLRYFSLRSFVLRLPAAYGTRDLLGESSLYTSSRVPLFASCLPDSQTPCETNSSMSTPSSRSFGPDIPRNEHEQITLCETNVRPNGADYQWVKVPLQELSICLDS